MPQVRRIPSDFLHIQDDEIGIQCENFLMFGVFVPPMIGHLGQRPPDEYTKEFDQPIEMLQDPNCKRQRTARDEGYHPYLYQFSNIENTIGNFSAINIGRIRVRRC